MRTNHFAVCARYEARHAERGQALPLVAALLLLLTAFASLAIDAGIWRYQEQLAQIAADAGALAAVAELKNSGKAFYTVANVDTTANGFAGGSASGALNDGGTGVTLTVNSPPKSGPATGHASAVEVIVSKALPVYFGWWSMTVSARAVGTYNTSGNCLMALQAFALDGGVLELPTCGMATGGSPTINGGTIDAKSISFYPSLPPHPPTYTKATPTIGAAAPADPCSSVPGCAYIKANPPSNACQFGGAITPSQSPLTAGTYCNTTFAGPGTITLGSGLYNFVNGFNVNSPAPSLVGTGVTIYTNASINFGSGTMNFSAPTSGNDANVVFYGTGSNAGLTFNSSIPAAFSGMVYVPAGSVILDGNSLTVGSVVANTIILNASGSITFNGAASSGGGAASSGGGLSE